MFTGIIEELGTLVSVETDKRSARLRIRSPHVLTDASAGDSIAVNGCCLTLTEHDGQTWTADVITTTLQATTLGALAAGDRVNLERPLRADGRLGGHIVQGHVDGIGEITGHEPTDPDSDAVGSEDDRGGDDTSEDDRGGGNRSEDDGTAEERGALLRVTLPEGTARYVVPRGSLAVDGVSLTVAEIDGDTATIGLIPETLARTTLGSRHLGSTVNIEVDVLAKYLEKQAETLVSAQTSEKTQVQR